METNQNEIDVRKIVRVVLEHWWWFAIGVAFFVLLGVCYYLRKTPQWTTDAAIEMGRRVYASGLYRRLYNANGKG